MPSIRAALGGLVLLLALLGAPPRASAQRYHTVRTGDSFASIARRHRVAVWDLALANRMRPSSKIRPGQVLEVPPPGVVYVRPGQSLWAIAKAHDCDVGALARANRMRKGGALRAGQRLVLPGFAGTTQRGKAEDWGEASEPGVVTLRTRTQEPVRITLRDLDGRVPYLGLVTLGQLMHRSDHDADDGASATEEPRPQIPHPRLAYLLSAISDHFGGRPIMLVSGFREVGRYTRETSRHVDGHATDIRVEGVPKRVLWDYCRSLLHTGCGFYPRSVFVHADVRDSEKQWVDWSRPGRRPRYGTLRRPYRSHERRSPKRPRVGRRVTRPDEVPLVVEVSGRPLERVSEQPLDGA